MFSSTQRWLINLLSAVSIILILVPGSMLLTGAVPPEPCEMSEFKVNIEVDGQVVEGDFSIENPISIKPGASLIITAEIETKPEPCEGIFSIDWLLVFVPRLSRVKSSATTPTREVLEITVDGQALESPGIDYIALMVYDSLKKKREELIIPLAVKGE